MHEPQDSPSPLESALSILVRCEAWPLIPNLLELSEEAALEVIRGDPLSEEARAAAVQLAHIEKLRSVFRAQTPDYLGDPFDVTQRPCPTWYGSPEEYGTDDDDEYEL